MNRNIIYDFMYFLSLLHCFLIILIFANISFAQVPLTLSDAVRLTLENHPEIGSVDQGLVSAKDALKKSQSELFPRLDLISNYRFHETIDKFEPIEISFDFLGTRQTISPTKDVPDYKSTIALQLTENLYTGGRVSNTIKGVRAEVDVAFNQKKIKERALILSTINAYWELKRAEKFVAIEGEKLIQSETILTVAKKRYEQGSISGLEKEKAELDVVNNRGDLYEAEMGTRIAMDRLLKEMGIIGTGREFNPVLQDEPEHDFLAFDEETLENRMTQALSLRSELKQLHGYIRKNEAGIRVAKADYYPQVSLVGEYNWTGYGEDNLGNSWQDIDRNYWFVMLQVNINFFEGFATQSNVNQAISELAAARFELEKQSQIIVYEVRKAYETLAGTSKRVDMFHKNVLLAEKNLNVARRQFELSVITINQVAEYYLSLADTRKKHLNALINFEIAKAEFKWALGDKMS